LIKQPEEVLFGIIPMEQLRVSVSGRVLHHQSRISFRVLSQRGLTVAVDKDGFYSLLIVNQSNGKIMYSEINIKDSHGEVETPYTQVTDEGVNSQEISVLLYSQIESISSSAELKVNEQVSSISFWVDVVPPQDKEFWVSALDTQESKYCRCLLQVKNTSSPYGICHASVKSKNVWCGLYYNFENLPHEQLSQYARLHNIPASGSVEQIIDRIYDSKQAEYGQV
jgi:hypothetical protein